MWLQSEGAQADLYNVCFSSHSHLQPVLPEAPALQHPALLTGSHHRPGRGRPLLLLDVEAPQTGVPSCPRPHTCKSHQSPAHHCFNPGLSLCLHVCSSLSSDFRGHLSVTQRGEAAVSSFFKVAC